MKIAIITSGIRPVPAIQGGAVENLIDFYLEYNEQHHLHDITIYSIGLSNINSHQALGSEHNHYHYIELNSFYAKIKKWLYFKRFGYEYYHHNIEFFIEQATRHIIKSDFDCILVENRPGIILKLRERISKPCILHLHNDFLNSTTKKASEIFNGYDRIIGVSDYITKRANNIIPNSRKCQTIYNAIDCKLFYDSTPISKRELGIFPNSFVIVYSGRLTEEKGVLQLIHALKELDYIHNIRLLVLGGGSYGDDLQQTTFTQRLKKESISLHEKVKFTGYIDYDKIPAYLKTADIAVVPSMWDEPFGLTVVEAMAAGLPLITTRSGGIPEICEGVATIVERDNIVDNLANAILDLYQHPEKREAMAKASLERSKFFDKETYAKKFFAAIENL